MTTKKTDTASQEEIDESLRHREILISLSNLQYKEEDFSKDKIDYEVVE